MPQKALLTIAGTDPSGGAGIQVDLQVFRDWGYHGVSTITAVVTQNTGGVISFDPCREDVLRSQLDAIADDVPIAGIKIGMLPTLEGVEAVDAFFDDHPEFSDTPLVIDTVLASGSGDTDMTRLGVAEAMLDTLMGRATVLTPNVPEIERLTGLSVRSRDEAVAASTELLKCGASAVLFKSGHMEIDEDDVEDLLVTADGDATWLEPLPRVNASIHGTGCQLSSAVCAALADGMELLDAVEAARRYLNDLLHSNIRRIGKGRPVVVRAEER